MYIKIFIAGILIVSVPLLLLYIRWLFAVIDAAEARRGCTPDEMPMREIRRKKYPAVANGEIDAVWNDDVDDAQPVIEYGGLYVTEKDDPLPAPTFKVDFDRVAAQRERGASLRRTVDGVDRNHREQARQDERGLNL